jgi:hypothetical protein
MKKLLLAAAVAFFASTASATIATSSHDFTIAAGTYGGGGASCAYCHMPHFAQSAAGAPLWARNLNLTGTGYTFFSSMVGGHSKPAAVGAGSAACLSCHDGTQAVTQILKMGNLATGNVQVPGSQVAKQIAMLATSPALIGVNLSNDHPISVQYNTAWNTNYAGLNAAPPPVFNITNGVSNVECTSCHNAHNDARNKTATQGSSAYPARQFMVYYTGDLCAACHSAK